MERFINLEIFLTGNLSLEYFRNSARCNLVQDTRLVRRLVFLAIVGALHSNLRFKSYSIDQYVHRVITRDTNR